MKNRSMQEELEDEDKENNKEVSFVKDSEQVWYDESLYISKFLKNDMLFLNKEITKIENLMCAQI